MPASLLVLHGYTMNGDTMRGHMAALAARFPPAMNVVYASAPHACSETSVERFYAGASVRRLPPPHLMWWNATDDGTEYRGWETSRDGLLALMRQHAPVGVLGFSQGAMMTALLATAWEELAPLLGFVIVVAGRTPRATALTPFFERPIRVPSLHVWGTRDGMSAVSPELVQCFDESTRQVVTWSGGHRVPVDGPGADAIADFVARRWGG